MNDDSRNNDRDPAQSYLDKVSDRYVFDRASGLYQPKPERKNENTSTDTTGRYKRVPFWVSVKTDWFVLTVSVATVVLLVATVRYARKQWLETNRSANASEIAAHSAASAANTASSTLWEMQHGQGATDTHTLAETSKDALLTVQRAFVSVQQSDVGWQPDGSMIIGFEWENGGNTPTLNMTSRVTNHWYQSPMTDGFDFSDYPVADRIVKQDIGPRSSTRSFPTKISAQDAKSIEQHSGHLYLWGWARYQDVFKDSPPHITRFCYEVTAITPNLAAKTTNFQTASCSQGNCTDGECTINER